jgi:hypothetical protein
MRVEQEFSWGVSLWERCGHVQSRCPVLHSGFVVGQVRAPAPTQAVRESRPPPLHVQSLVLAPAELLASVARIFVRGGSGLVSGNSHQPSAISRQVKQIFLMADG